MKSYSFLLIALGAATCFCAAENVSAPTPISRLQRIGKMDVLSGSMQIAHYGEKSFTFGSTVSAAIIGEGEFRMSVDYAGAKLNGNELVLPKLIVWHHINEGKTYIYKQWATGVITKKDKMGFLNNQYAYIDVKARRAVSDESELMQQAQAQAERIARAYLLSWNPTIDVQKVTFDK